MTRDLRVGDRVTATGTVINLFDIEDGQVTVRWDGASGGWSEEVATLTWTEPPQPPVGSVVVKGGVAWIRWNTGIGAHWRDQNGNQEPWSDLSDGDVIFRAGEE